MKKLIFLLTAITLIGFSSCTKEDDDYNTDTVLDEPITLVVYRFYVEPIDTNLYYDAGAKITYMNNGVVDVTDLSIMCIPNSGSLNHSPMGFAGDNVKGLTIDNIKENSKIFVLNNCTPTKFTAQINKKTVIDLL